MLLALVTLMAGCGGAGSELDAPGPASTGSGIGTSIAPATASTPLNIAIKPVAGSPNTSTASVDASGSTSASPFGVPTVSGK
jgi:hypothetical protein